MKKRNRSFISDFITRMLPSLIAGQLVITICSMIDTALAGQFLGGQAIAAEGMVTPVVMIIAGLSSVMAAGNTNICSNESGKCDVEEMSRVFSTTVTVSVGISLAFTVLVLIFSSPICTLLGLESGTGLFEQTRAYMCGYVLLTPALSVVMVFPGILQIEGDNVTGIVAVLMVFALDIIFDLINLFVIKGGVFGMAMASTLSYYAATAYILIKFFSSKHTVRFSLKKVCLGRLKEIMSYGAPALIHSVSVAIYTGVINTSFLEYGSEMFVSTFTVANNIGELLICFPDGMCELAVIVTGIVNGEKDRKGLKEILMVLLRKSVLISVLLTVIACLAGGILPRIYTSDANILALAGHGIRIFSLQILFRCICECYAGYLRGIKRNIAGSAIFIVLSAAISVFAYGTPIFFGVDAIWYSYTAASFFTAACILVFIGISSHKNPFLADAWILQPEDYGIPEKDCIEYSSLSIVDLCAFSADSAEFVKEHGGSSRQMVLIPLYIEEMGKNILSYAFDGKKEPILSIKLIFDEGNFKICFRDNGKHFNPEEFSNMYSREKDRISNFGIHIVRSLATEFTYMNTMSYNNLVVSV